MQNPDLETKDKVSSEEESQKLGVIMYIEEKPGLAGHARIGRVTFSQSRRTVNYRGRRLQSLNGNGYKANYFNVTRALNTGFLDARRMAMIHSTLGSLKSTHWEKLMARVERGVGNPCPLLLIGLPASIVVYDDAPVDPLEESDTEA